MPALSPTMEEGTLAKWTVKEGDTVESGQIMAEIETDKATMEFEAVDEGVIGKLLIAEGTAGVKVNTPIAVLLEEGEDASAADNAEPAKSDNTPNDVKSAAAPESDAKPAAEKPAEDKTEAPKAAEAPKPAPTADKGERVFATPLARRIAADKGVDLKSISGSGPKGRIVKADVENAKPGAAPAPTASTSLAQSPSAGMRKTIAARLTEAKQTVPHFYLRRGIQLDKLLSTRAEINAGLAESGVKLSVNDFIIKACAKALQDVPDANVVWADDRILKLDASDVAVAVAIEGGLFTPVIRDSDSKTLSTISAEMKDLAGRARDRKLAPHEYQGGSFAISNLGMMGVENFDAVINPPHGSILAVGAGAGMKKPIVGDDGSVSVATVMSVTLSVDHRAIDGALGATFLDAIVRYLENPLTIFA
ncbi:UNVERIFIED_CONTAM: hypothetical protein GTU68_040074 [Idotea baltica]|nr:hypothetical protein [Idotea baltica]